MKVKCVSIDEDVQNFGSSTGKVNDLEIGTIYEVVNKTVHTWHTQFSLLDVTGTFNSCLFKEIKYKN
jgi:hypothetical protein